MAKDEDWKEQTKTAIRIGGVAAVRTAAVENGQEVVNKQVAENKRAQSLRRAGGEYVAQPIDMGWALTPTDIPQRRRVLIAPQQAAEILEKTNLHNRKRSKGKMDKLRARVAQSGWVYTHQGIALDSDGRLLDGQLRLMFCRDEGITIDIDMSIGMDPDIFYDVDTGDPRTASENLAMQGEVNTAALQASIILIHWYETDREGMRNSFKKPYLANRKVVHLLQDRYGDRLRDAVREGQRLYLAKNCPRIPQSGMAAAIYLIGSALSESDQHYLEDFLLGYEKGSNLSDGDARGALRTFWYAINNKLKRRVTNVDAMAHVLKAWNQWGSMEYVTNFYFRVNEKVPVVEIPFTTP